MPIVVGHLNVIPLPVVRPYGTEPMEIKIFISLDVKKPKTSAGTGNQKAWDRGQSYIH